MPCGCLSSWGAIAACHVCVLQWLLHQSSQLHMDGTGKSSAGAQLYHLPCAIAWPTPSQHIVACADEATRESVDAKCRKLTAPWVRERAATVPDIELCGFYEDYEKAGADAVLPPGVYTLQDLRQFGRKKGWCPYYLARHMISVANVVVFNYQYMLDPKVSQMVRGLSKLYACLPISTLGFLGCFEWFRVVVIDRLMRARMCTCDDPCTTMVRASRVCAEIAWHCTMLAQSATAS